MPNSTRLSIGAALLAAAGHAAAIVGGTPTSAFGVVGSFGSGASGQPASVVGGGAVDVGHDAAGLGTAVERPQHAAVAGLDRECRVAVAVVRACEDHAVVADGGKLGDVAQGRAAGAGGLLTDAVEPGPATGDVAGAIPTAVFQTGPFRRWGGGVSRCRCSSTAGTW